MSEDAVARLEDLRAVLLGDAKLRAGSEALVESMLAALADVDDDASAQAWLRELAGGEPVWGDEITVGELRARLRLMLEELAARDAPS